MLIAYKVAAGGIALIGSAPAYAAEGPAVLGVPVDFILFGFTLLGVALFHRHTLRVALAGLAIITLYKLGFTGFKSGSGIPGLLAHLTHEWVILTNLLCLLLGFALLSRHFEKTHLPAVLPRFLPHDWKGCFALLVIVFVLSSFLDNIAAALIGGAMAHTLFRAKVHIGYLAAIVAASNAGGSGSVVGDTTTTMMWIDGVDPLDVFEAYVAASVALVVCGIPAAMQQQRYSPILHHQHEHIHVDLVRLGIVFFILIAAIVTNVVMNVKFPEVSDHFPFIGASVVIALLLSVPLRRPDWEVLPESFKGSIFLAYRNGTRFRVRRVRQYPAYCAGAETGGVRLGLSSLRSRLRRIDDLVRLERRCGSLQHVSGIEIGGALALPRLARDARLCARLFYLADRHGLASQSAPQGGRRGDQSPRSDGPRREPLIQLDFGAD